jgi:formylglycine-generating enzyme required for sulfatase activity
MLDKNFSGANRQAEITITSGDETKSVTITQKNTDSSGEILKASIAFGEDVPESMEVEIGKDVELAVVANTAFEVFVSPVEGSPEDGITCSDPSGADTVVICKPTKRGDYIVTITSGNTAETPTVTLSAGIPGMVFVSVGENIPTFIMGCTPGQGGFNNNSCVNASRSAHEVTLTRDYYIGQTEVTQQQWQEVMGDGAAESIAAQTFPGADRPVTDILWTEIETFINKLNERDAGIGRTWRLPTEAEWEYAVRGGLQSQGYRFPGGNQDVLDELAWHIDISNSQTHPVKEKQPNELGLYDMAGNVRELCADWYGTYPTVADPDPTGPDTGTRNERVVRGGSWLDGANNMMVVSRNYQDITVRVRNVGFRLALVLDSDAHVATLPLPSDESLWDSATSTVEGVWDSAISGIKSLWNSITK